MKGGTDVQASLIEPSGKKKQLANQIKDLCLEEIASLSVQRIKSASEICIQDQEKEIKLD